jgi:hypothetical protein
MPIEEVSDSLGQMSLQPHQCSTKKKNEKQKQEEKQPQQKQQQSDSSKEVVAIKAQMQVLVMKLDLCSLQSLQYNIHTYRLPSGYYLSPSTCSQASQLTRFSTSRPHVSKSIPPLPLSLPGPPKR